MTIIEKRKLEDCFDGSSVYRYKCGCEWTKESIQCLDVLGKLEYFQEFPRPFFRITTKGGLQIKGVEGERYCRIIFPREKKVELSQLIENAFNRI
jgi:hypothetical protein